jgi:hypothetical protein
VCLCVCITLKYELARTKQRGIWQSTEIDPVFRIAGQNFPNISRYFRIFYLFMYSFHDFSWKLQRYSADHWFRNTAIVAWNILLVNIAWRLLGWTEQNHARPQLGSYISYSLYTVGKVRQELSAEWEDKI